MALRRRSGRATPDRNGARPALTALDLAMLCNRAENALSQLAGRMA